MKHQSPAEVGRQTEHLWLPYTQMAIAPPPLEAVETAGARIRLKDGRDLVDGIASWWTACHGYNHPHIRAAVAGQLEAMPHVMFGGLVHEPAVTLANRLTGILPAGLERVFFSESGSVAVEIALKLAIQYRANRGEMGATRFVAFRRGYHGDTLGAMAVSDPELGFHDRRHFGGYVPEHFFADVPRDAKAAERFDAFLTQHASEVAGVIVEPLVQAAGGMHFHSAESLRWVAEACRRHGLLLIADEVATGFGRTGRLFACEEAGISPDILCLSKALTGGTMALAATVASAEIFEAFLGPDPEKAFLHGPTFMANPLACAAANASLDLFEREPRLEQIAAIEAHLGAALEPCRDLPGVRDVRAKGAIGVVELEGNFDHDWLRARFVEEGTWIRPFGNIVYLMPAFVIEPEDLERLTGAVVKVVGEWSAHKKTPG
ncbi:MAG: adenosylmethionine--8-amino-7-oxononanoate transaminase [Alphaproteobacteria bacterium]|nr:adenosylmethionine--8-amino-7-oxononanoate transaminase [Alphaproteobacteria bacterium]